MLHPCSSIPANIRAKKNRIYKFSRYVGVKTIWYLFRKHPGAPKNLWCSLRWQTIFPITFRWFFITQCIFLRKQRDRVKILNISIKSEPHHTEFEGPCSIGPESSRVSSMSSNIWDVKPFRAPTPYSIKDLANLTIVFTQLNKVLKISSALTWLCWKPFDLQS